MKFLTKRNIIVAVSVLLVLAIAVPLLIIEPWNTTELTDRKRSELINSLQKNANGRLNITPGTGNYISNNGGYYYYGTYNGYDVIFSIGDFDEDTSFKIGDEYFFYISYFRIQLHRNGEFVDLANAYDRGLINDENLRIVAQMHYDHVASRVSIRDAYREQGFGERYEGK